MTNCCGDYHYSDCPTRTGASYDDYDRFENFADHYDAYWEDYEDESYEGNEDAAMESSLFGDC